MMSINHSIVSFKIIVLVIDFLLQRAKANLTNDFIVDYFNHKQPSSIVGYSCNSLTGNESKVNYKIVF